MSNIYISSLSKVFTEKGFDTISYADDNNGYQIFSLTNTSEIFNDLIPSFIEKLKVWMNSFFLKINESKTELIVLAHPIFHNGLSINSVTRNGDVINITDRVKYLGFHFDKFLSMTTHVNKIVSHSYNYVT